MTEDYTAMWLLHDWDKILKNDKISDIDNLFGFTFIYMYVKEMVLFGLYKKSDLQAGIWFGNVAPSPIITIPLSFIV